MSVRAAVGRVFARPALRGSAAVLVAVTPSLVSAAPLDEASLTDRPGQAVSASLREPQWTPADSRRGVHVGVYVGPIGAFLIRLEKAIFGISTGLFLNVGILPLLDFRVGIAGDAAGSGTSYVSAGVPSTLRLNLGSSYSLALGVSAGVVSDTSTAGLFVGPIWSPATFRFGERRQFELEIAQGLHFDVVRGRKGADLMHFQTALILSYLDLDPPRTDSASMQSARSRSRAFTLPSGL